MIKKSIFEEELIRGMQAELQPTINKQAMKNLTKAADYLNSAIDIFEDLGLTSQADQVIEILNKIANSDQDEQDARGAPKRPADPRKIPDAHIKNLTPEKMTKNLKDHGTVFNMADDGSFDELNIDFDDIELDDIDSDETFEDSD